MLKCLECGKEGLKRISNTHLITCCGLTMQEYALKHNIKVEELTLQEVKEKYKRTLESVSEEVKKQKLEKRREEYSKNNSIVFTEEEEQIVLGSLLGDGYIHAGSTLPYSPYLVLEHGIKQLDYLLSKGMRLERLGAKFYQYYVFNSVKGRVDTINQVRTSSNPTFGTLCKLFYGKGKTKHKVEYEYVKKLKPLGLAVWYMDDGTKADRMCYLSTQRYTYDSQLTLQRVLKENFDLSSILYKVDENSFSLKFDAENSKKFKDIVKPHIPPSMYYKIEETHDPILMVTKKVEFDAAHFLSEYKGKCSNLHGGRYQLEVFIKGQINRETGMVMDYTYLKKVIKTHIIDRLDHALVNYQFPELQWRSTTELMVVVFWFTLLHMLPGLHRLRLYETPDSWCEYEGPSWDELKKNKNHPDLLFFNSLSCFSSKSHRTRIIGKIRDIFDECCCKEVNEDTDNILFGDCMELKNVEKEEK